MDSGGTGTLEEDSDESDTVTVPIRVELLPARSEPVGTPPNVHFIWVHSARVTTLNNTLTFESRGFLTAEADFLLIIAEELIRAARSRLRQGTIQVTRL